MCAPAKRLLPLSCLGFLAAAALLLLGACESTGGGARVAKPVHLPSMPAHAAARPTGLLASDDFGGDLSAWAVEQQPGGTVTLEDGHLVIADEAGCTVWYRQPFDAPVIITYTAKASSQARVSDLNCFWMASDPRSPDDLFAPGNGRTGKFSTYDTLRTYYVGYGGNTNSTTRFRRYDGSGARPLLPEHDKQTPDVLLIPDHEYHIALVAAGGRVQYIRDGQVIFDWADPAPLTHGWFGFRTVKSRLVIGDFRVWRAKPRS